MQLFSVGGIYALIPVFVILGLIATAASLSRGANILELFGIGTLLGLPQQGAGAARSGQSIRKAGQAAKGTIKARRFLGPMANAINTLRDTYFTGTGGGTSKDVNAAAQEKRHEYMPSKEGYLLAAIEQVATTNPDLIAKYGTTPEGKKAAEKFVSMAVGKTGLNWTLKQLPIVRNIHMVTKLEGRIRSLKLVPFPWFYRSSLRFPSHLSASEQAAKREVLSIAKRNLARDTAERQRIREFILAKTATGSPRLAAALRAHYSRMPFSDLIATYHISRGSAFFTKQQRAERIKFLRQAIIHKEASDEYQRTVQPGAVNAADFERVWRQVRYSVPNTERGLRSYTISMGGVGSKQFAGRIHKAWGETWGTSQRPYKIPHLIRIQTSRPGAPAVERTRRKRRKPRS